MNAINNALNPKTNAVRVEGDIQVTPGDIEKVKNATDLVKTFTYLDAGTDDERVNTITYSSVVEGLTFTETFNWAGLTGAYRIDNITIS